MHSKIRSNFAIIARPLSIIIIILIILFILLIFGFSPATAEFDPAVLISVEDSLGNINTNSWTEDFTGDWSCNPSCPDLSVNVGETITLTATASDPNTLPLEYKFSIQPSGGSFEVLQD